MAQTYFPHDCAALFVKASKPHPDNTQYKVSRGLEVWGDENHEVVKIQMVYDGQVAGRRSPSFPLGTDDFQRVMSKVQELISTR